MNTIQCNQKCSKCSHWKYKDTSARLDVEKIINTLITLPKAKEFCIVGGEPLLFKSEILKIIEGIKNTCIKSVIVTNGVPMDKNFTNQITDYNVHIVFSIDTMDREFWKFVRGTNSYEKVMKNFEYALKKLSRNKVSIQSVLSQETKEHIKDVGKYAKKMMVHHSIQDYIEQGFEGNWSKLERKHAMIPKGHQQCFAAGNNLSILQNGNVYTCFQQSLIEECSEPLGNLNHQNITDILSNDYVKKVDKKMRVCDLPCKVLKCNTKNNERV